MLPGQLSTRSRSACSTAMSGTASSVATAAPPILTIRPRSSWEPSVGCSRGKDMHAGRDEHAGHDMAEHDEHAGHDKHAGHSVAMFRDRFWLSVALTIPVLFWSEMIQDWLGYTAPTFTHSDRIPAILGTIVFVYGGLPFLKGGLAE